MRTEEGLLLLLEDGTIQWANSAAGELLGFTQQELREKALPLLDTSNAGSASAGPVASAFRAILARTTDEAEGNARFPNKADKRVALHWKLWALPSISGRQVLLSMSETAQASAEGPITSSYRDIFEHAVEGIFRTTPDGRYLEVNPALARMLGYETAAELMDAVQDLNTDLYVEPSRRAEFVRHMAEQGFVSGLESQARTADGRVIWIAESARAVRGPDGSTLYYEGSVIDITERKRAEAAVKRSEEKFRHLAEMTSVIPWEADVETGAFTYVGPQAEKFLGVPVEEWLQPGFWARKVHPEDRGWVSIVRSEAVDKRQPLECEYRMIRADQRVVWAREIVSVLSEVQDAHTIGGFILDVSYRREAEESLRESKQFIERIASASPTILYLYDPARQQTIYANGRVRHMLGYSTEALAEMHPCFVLALAHPSELQAQREYLASLRGASLETVFEREFRLRSASGTWVWIYSRECVFERNAEGDPVRMVGTLEDITLHRQTLDELESNEALFRRLAETTQVVPFSLDASSSHFTYVGPQAEAIFGYPVRDWYSPGFWIRMLHPDDIVEGTRFASESCEAPYDFETEFRVRRADGEIIWVRQIVHCEFEEDDRTHVRGFLLDITRDKLADEERERTRTEFRELAARSHKAREEERMNVAREIHDELGQALTLLKLDLSWLSSRVSKAIPEPEGQPLSDKIAAMEQTMTSTLQTVRRVLSALRPPLLDEFGLADAIEWHATEFARRAGLRCDLDVEVVEHVPIEAALAVFRIFQEITTNIARHAKASRMQVDLRVRGPNLVLVVTDNGRGISESDRTKKGHFGLLGMRERAWAFGGQVWVEGAPSGGTLVRVELPLPAGHAPAQQESSDSAGHAVGMVKPSLGSAQPLPIDISPSAR